MTACSHLAFDPTPSKAQLLLMTGHDCVPHACTQGCYKKASSTELNRKSGVMHAKVQLGLTCWGCASQGCHKGTIRGLQPGILCGRCLTKLCRHPAATLMQPSLEEFGALYYAATCIKEQQIGLEFALYYEAYATFHELRGNCSAADAVYQDGIKRCGSRRATLARVQVEYEQWCG
eukprot:scaffold234402_cov23-Tisochrysis_lutea.AAC.3